MSNRPDRERGAAHINIYFFLVLLMMFLGTLWFGYMQMTQRRVAEASAQRARIARLEAQRDKELYRRYAEEITDLLGEVGDYEGSRSLETWKATYGELRENAKPKPISVTLPGLLKKKMENSAKKLEIPTASVTPLGTFLSKITNRDDAQKQAIADAVSARIKVEQQRAALDKKFATEASTRSAQIARDAQEYTSRKSDLVDEVQRKDTLVTETSDELRRSNEAKDQMRDQHRDEIMSWTKKDEVNKLHMDHLQSRVAMINPPEQPDGEIINASMKAMRAWISLGSKDMLRRGTHFRITRPLGGKDGGKVVSKVVKAMGEVIKVEPDRAEVRLYDIRDKYDPVVRGDEVSSSIFGPGVKRNIALVGRFSYPYSKPMVKTLLERLGNRVIDKVGINVDLVIVGGETINEAGDGMQKISDTDEYKFALEHRIEIITLHKVRDLLKISK